MLATNRVHIITVCQGFGELSFSTVQRKRIQEENMLIPQTVSKCLAHKPVGGYNFHVNGSNCQMTLTKYLCSFQINFMPWNNEDCF